MNTSRGESRTSTNSVVLLMCKRENELSENNFGAQTGVNLLSQHLFLLLNMYKIVSQLQKLDVNALHISNIVCIFVAKLR